MRAVTALTGPTVLGATSISTSLAGKVVATAEVLSPTPLTPGQYCDIPLTVRLTTGRSGPLRGTPLKTDLKGVSRGAARGGPVPGAGGPVLDALHRGHGGPGEPGAGPSVLRAVGASTIWFDAAITLG